MKKIPFANGTQVELFNTSSSLLDGLVCTVVGISSFSVTGSAYILRFHENTDYPYYPYDCFVLTESCFRET
jgi:hypothetical protein